MDYLVFQAQKKEFTYCEKVAGAYIQSINWSLVYFRFFYHIHCEYIDPAFLSLF